MRRKIQPKVNVVNKNTAVSKRGRVFPAPSSLGGSAKNLKGQLYDTRRPQEARVVANERDSRGRWTGWVKAMLPAGGEAEVVRALYNTQVGEGSKQISPPTKGTSGVVNRVSDYYVFSPMPLAEAAGKADANDIRRNPLVHDGEHFRSASYSEQEGDESSTKANYDYLHRSGTLERRNLIEDIVSQLGKTPDSSGEMRKYLGEELLALFRITDVLKVLVNELGDTKIDLTTLDISNKNTRMSTSEAIKILAESISIVASNTAKLYAKVISLEVGQSVTARVGGSCDIHAGGQCNIAADESSTITTPNLSLDGDVVSAGTGEQKKAVHAGSKYKTFCPVIQAPVGGAQDPGFVEGTVSQTITVSV